MNGHEDSDRPIVPKKTSNKGVGKSAPAEEVEGRGLAEGNLCRQSSFWTLSQEELSNALGRIRQAAKGNKELRFTALYHHIHNLEMLRHAFSELRRQASAGVDGETWRRYRENLEENLQDLSARLKRGAYRAKPVRRAYILKEDGRQRPLGVPALEDKIVQRATVEVLNAIYESDFVGFSYGFRPGRNPHMALDALQAAIRSRKVGWVLDADICGYFDSIDRKWLVKFLEHRIGDRRVVRLIRKWLNAGVLEDGAIRRDEYGTPQGGSISPLLANIYLHYAYDLWVRWWRKAKAKGDLITVRYADDFVAGFQHKWEAMRFLSELKERFRKFGLKLHPEKTRLIRFGRFAASERGKCGEGRPETFNFLGFTHVCGTTRDGKFMVLRLTMKKRLQAKLKIVKAELRRRMHEPIPILGAWLKSVVQGHFRYYGVPRNMKALSAFWLQINRYWCWTLRRRSQKHRMNWVRMKTLIARWIPTPRLYHRYLEYRFAS